MLLYKRENDTSIENTANSNSIRELSHFLLRCLPIIKPNPEPEINGVAIAQGIVLVMLANSVLPTDTMVNTPRDVATIDVMGKSVYFFKAGTIINPPPTPSSPESNPALAPDPINARAHGTVQISLLID
jgi:hypothetical protein